MDKTKKRRIVIALLCMVVILVGLIASILLITQKKLDISANFVPEYNNHTEMVVANPPKGYSILNNSSPSYYSNGNVMVQNASQNGFGIYSFNEKELTIPANYSIGNLQAITIRNNYETTKEHIFKVGAEVGTIANKIIFYNDEGEDLEITKYIEDKNVTYGYIKQKIMKVSDKRNGVKVSTKNKFETVKIELQSIDYLTSYISDEYNYELWSLTDIDGNEYTNLYEVDDDDRELMQTINNPIGKISALNENQTNLYFLENGTPRIYTINSSYTTDNTMIANVTIFDKNFKEKNSFTLDINDNLKTYFKAGDSAFFQYIMPATEDKYDYASDGNYFRVETYKLNLKNGKYKKVKFKYVINNVSESFNNSISLIYAQPIQNKALVTEEKLLVNSNLNIKEISYNIESITKISDKRYIVENSEGQYLINERYDLICYLGKYDSFFTTKESIILKDNSTNFSYVCNLDGVVVKKYSSSEITNIHDENYYMVTTTTTKNGELYTEKYLEKVGIRAKTPIYSKAENSTTYNYNGKEYVAYSDSLISNGLGIITRVKKTEGTTNKFTYEFYNLHGKLLMTLNNFTTSDRVLTFWNYKDDDNAVLQISTTVGGEEFYLVVDR